MRLLFCATAGSRQPGGGRTFCRGVVEALAPLLGADLGVVVTSGVADEWRAIGGCAQILEVRNVSGIPQLLQDPLQLKKAIGEFEPDILFYPHEWVPLKDQRTVLMWQNIAFLDPRSRGERPARDLIYRKLGRRTIHHAEAVLAPSASAAELISDFAPRVADRVSVVPEPVPLPSALPPTKQEKGPGVNVLIVAGEARHKRPELVRTLVRSLPRPFIATVVGLQGDEHSRHRWIVGVSRQSLLEMVLASDVIAYPSVVESFGLPAFEAAALGRPLLVSEASPFATAFPSRAIALPDEVGAWQSAVVSQAWRGIESPSEVRRYINPARLGIDLVQAFRGALERGDR